MIQPILLTALLAVYSAYAQNADLVQSVGELFGNETNRDPYGNLIEVTSSAPGGFGRLDRCGQGSQQGKFICVPYYQCDGDTRMVIQDGTTNGIGLIDIRFGENACDHFLDVCCGVPPSGINPVSEVPLGSTAETSQTPIINIPVSSTTSAPAVTPVTSTTSRPSSVSCGIRNANGIDFKITGNRDNEAEYGEFPWMVALLWKNVDLSKNKTLSFCGGSIIAPNVVLTGAHCVADLQPGQYKVRAGEWDTQTKKERLPYQERDVIQSIIHEQYFPQAVYNDVALLILSSPFDQADNIGSICLPNQDEVITSRECLASGWGKNIFGKEGQYQVILKKIQLPMVQREPCQKALRNTRLGEKFELHRSFICAGGEYGKDTCTGDGGSPLVCPDPKNPTRYVQTGIVAWGIGCGEKDIPGVYANVAMFRNWVDNQLSRLNVNTNSYV